MGFVGEIDLIGNENWNWNWNYIEWMVRQWMIPWIDWMVDHHGIEGVVNAAVDDKKYQQDMNDVNVNVNVVVDDSNVHGFEVLIDVGFDDDDGRNIWLYRLYLYLQFMVQSDCVY